MEKTKASFFLTLIILILVLFFSFIYSLSIGVVNINYADIIGMLYYNILESSSQQAKELLASVNASVIFDLRLPRIIMAVLSGGALALGGVVMQALIRNPLADPYILGVSSGAAMGATASIILGMFSWFGLYGVSLGAFCGALLVTFTVFAITYTTGAAQNNTKLILAGTALNAICGASTSLLVYLAKDVDGIRDATFWIMGSMGKVTWGYLPFVSVVFIVLASFFIYNFRILNASLLGEDMALILGVSLEKSRIFFLTAVAILVSMVVAATGIIGFVGLVIPHIVRIICGNNHLKLLPYSILGGAIYMLWCDVLARSLLLKTELPIGILTAFIGGPFFLYLMCSKKYGFGDK
ncbi:iron ABC transporter permease [uncultured Phascolarctobacterium sp.]|mgnify:FL=1|uniref:FecCD family ABC transporter permease n=1 Tax=uncultured Phascolarctobacterium sp. TaxID=512296 RepID=UPI0026383E9B|nr:iron ABC transporter permease [uncultured Phascolarctobacterium sp.]